MRDPLRDRRLAYALAEARERLLALDPAVTSIGIGFGRKGGRETGEVCLQVGVEEKLPAEQVTPVKMMPQRIVPRVRGEDPVRVDVVPTGVLAPQPHELQQRARPACPGYSIGHFLSTAGTLGAVLSDVRRRRYILSNNHVLANENQAREGDAILQPGPADGGAEPGEVIGRLHSFVPLLEDGVNTVDCALAAAERDRDLLPAVHEIGTVIGPGTAELGMRVRKCGRTTGCTLGRIRRVAVTARIHYGRGVLLFTDIFETGAMSQPGDSGSLVIDEANRAVGLLFAGSVLSTLICPIQGVIEGLGLRDLVWF